MGDTIVAGQSYGSVRAMLDQHGTHKDEARPSDAGEILGLNSVPAAGDEFRGVEDARDVGAIAETDVTRAMASNAIIIGFGVRPQPKARDAAGSEKFQDNKVCDILEANEDVEAARTD